MALDPDQGEDRRHDLDSDDAPSHSNAEAGDSSGAEVDLRTGASDRAGASPAPTIDGESFGIPSYPDDGEVEAGEVEEQDAWGVSSPVDFFQDLGYGPAPGRRRSLRDVIWELPEQYLF